MKAEHAPGASGVMLTPIQAIASGDVVASSNSGWDGSASLKARSPNLPLKRAHRGRQHLEQGFASLQRQFDQADAAMDHLLLELEEATKHPVEPKPPDGGRGPHSTRYADSVPGKHYHGHKAPQRRSPHGWDEDRLPVPSV